jgi:putative transcriptional regulator
MSAGLMPTMWRLNELMARHRVSGKALADELGISTNAVSALRTAETMPKINGDRLDQIAAALTKLSELGETVRGVDLLEYRKSGT